MRDPASSAVRTPAHALFVHGMGRSPLSGWPMLRALQRAGITTHTFGYTTTFEDLDGIQRRLRVRLQELAGLGDHVVIGHSLGGVLLRAALADMPARCRRPTHGFLLGSPQAPARMAQRLGGNPVFRVLTGDCGQLLGSRERMAAVGPLTIPTTSIVGVRGLPVTRGVFGEAPNDGVVSLAEVSAGWITDQVQVPVVHTLLPSSGLVTGEILRRLNRHAGQQPHD